MNSKYFRYAGIALLALSVVFVMGNTMMAGLLFGQNCRGSVCGHDEDFAQTTGLALFAVGSLVFAASFWKDKRAAILDEPRKKCPYCAELIQQEARLCRFCGKEL